MHRASPLNPTTYKIKHFSLPSLSYNRKKEVLPHHQKALQKSGDKHTLIYNHHSNHNDLCQ